jgi:hypothetical protein
MRYRATWGTSVAVLTGIIAGGVAIWTVVAIAWGVRLGSVPVVMPLVVLVWSRAYSPTGYRIAGGELLIERPVGTLRLESPGPARGVARSTARRRDQRLR